MSVYSTGEIARLCGVSVRTVQFYDGKGLLSPIGNQRRRQKALQQSRCGTAALYLHAQNAGPFAGFHQRNSAKRAEERNSAFAFAAAGKAHLHRITAARKSACLDSISMSNAEKRRGNSGALSLRHRGNYERQKATSYHTRHDAGRRHCDGCHSAGIACALDCKRRLASVCRGNAVCHCHGHLGDAVLPSACFLCLPALPRGIPPAFS